MCKLNRSVSKQSLLQRQGTPSTALPFHQVFILVFYHILSPAAMVIVKTSDHRPITLNPFFL